jgi:hypothetical protein
MRNDQKLLKDLLGLEHDISDLHRWARILYMAAIDDMERYDAVANGELKREDNCSLGLVVVEHVEDLTKKLKASFYAACDDDKAT